MIPAFVVFLIAYASLTIVSHFKAASPRVRSVTYLLRGALMTVAFVIAYREGVFSRQIVSPVYIGAGLLAGHAIFGMSLLATHRSVGDTAAHFFRVGAIWNFAMASPYVLTSYVVGAVGEELVYRVAAQPLLIRSTNSAIGGILVTALIFSVVHKHFVKNPFLAVSRFVGGLVSAFVFNVAHKQSADKPLLEAIEFFAFALLLGVLYHWTGSFVFIVVIHAVRNIESTYLDYLNKVEELGDADRASEAMERAYTRRRTEET